MNYYYKYIIRPNDINTIPQILAQLNFLPFSGFEELETSILAYLPGEESQENVARALEELQEIISFSVKWSKEEKQNWNAVWESNFPPIDIEGCCTIRAPFHPPAPRGLLTIHLQPRMAFGTGHHATTYMMLRAQCEEDWVGKKVLDFGCGTGILGIYACLKGASEVQGVDIELPAVENAQEHAQINGVNNFYIQEGGLNQAPPGPYDYVLANINRGVLLSHVEALQKVLRPEGTLLLSGILSEDEALVTDAYQKAGWQWDQTYRRGEWIAQRWLLPA